MLIKEVELLKLSASVDSIDPVVAMPRPDGLRYGDGHAKVRVEISKKADGDGNFWGEGWASKDDVDSYNEIVRPDAFNESLHLYMAQPMILYMHDWWGVPIGMTTEIEVREHGIWIRFKLFATDMGRNVVLCIREGLVNSLSIGFSVDEIGEDDEGRSIIEKGRLFETSVVNLGACPTALFSESKMAPMRQMMRSKSFTVGDVPQSLLTKTGGPLDGHRTKRSSHMLSPVELDRIGKSADTLLKAYPDDLATITADLASSEVKFKGMIMEIKGTLAETVSGAITSDQFDNLSRTMAADFLDVNEKITKLGNARKLGNNPNRMSSMIDWKTALWQHKGKSKLEVLLIAPVDYAKCGAEGELIKAIRNAYDQCKCIDAYFKGQGHSGYGGIHTLESWRTFTELVKYFDPDMAKAMDSTNTGYGLEWVNDAWSAELYELYEIERGLSARFPHFTMTTDTFNWPIKTAHGQAYLIDNPTTLTPDKAKKSDWGTGKITFDVDTYAVAMAVSKVLTEDSIIAIVPEVQKEIVWGLKDGEEDVIINGDDGTTHFDTGRTTEALLGCLAAFDGLRKIAVDDSNTWDTQSTSLGDATTAYAYNDILYNQEKLGDEAMDLDNIIHIIGVKTWFKTIKFEEFRKPGTYGTAAGEAVATGKLKFADGVEVVVSKKCPENLNASGIFDNSTTDNACILTTWTRGFKVADRREIGIEFKYDPETQQYVFVGTMRKDFKKMAASTRTPVAYGYNIDN